MESLLALALACCWYMCYFQLQMFPDNAVKRDMARMPAKCIHPYCTWAGIFKDYEVLFSFWPVHLQIAILVSMEYSN